MRSSRCCVGASLLTVLLSAGATLAWNSTQGPRLHGERRHGKPKDVVWFPIDGWSDGEDKPFTKVVVEKGELVGYREKGDPLRGIALLHATVKAEAIDGAEVTYRIEKINPPPRWTNESDERFMVNRRADIQHTVDLALNESTLYYTLMDVVNHEYYCDKAQYPPDADGGVQAVPVAEVWNSTGTQGRNEKHFTMACMGGAIAKCYHWGYQGWRPHPKAKAYVQACTRMAMADYCGDGRSHTLKGTPIDMYDFVAPPRWVHPNTGRPARGWSFETAWTGGDGKPPYLEKQDSDASVGGALCLSKLRWSSMPPDSPVYPQESPPPPGSPRCLMLKDDPRLKKDRYDDLVCDYITDGVVDHERLKRKGALLFNRSQFLDFALRVWTSSSGEHWTTITDLREDRSYSASPLPLGAVLSQATPASVTNDLPALVALKTYSNGQDHLTTTGTPPRGYDVGPVVREGLIYPCVSGGDWPPHSIPLVRINNPADSVTTTDVQPPLNRLDLRVQRLQQCQLNTGSPPSPAVIEGYLPVLTAD